MTFALLNPMAPVWPSSYLAVVFDAVHHSFPFEIVSSLGFWFSSFLSCHFFSIPFAFSYPSPHFEGRGQDSNFGPLLVIITPLVISSSFMAWDTVCILLTPSPELTPEFQMHRSNYAVRHFHLDTHNSTANLKCPSRVPNLYQKACSSAPLHLLFLWTECSSHK